MPGPLTVDLHAVREPRRGLLGGKGAGLAALASAGLPVPPGFCLTTDAYREALAGLVDAGRVEPGALRDGLPEAVREAVATALAALAGRDEGVAVRSSATVEDGAASSFAGQQVTTLNVRGAEAVLEAVGRCWASLWEEGALVYRRGAGAGKDPWEPAEMAVVVQQLVPAEVSGVLFTADPTTGNNGHMVVDAAFGLGETVVGGGAVDTYVLDRSRAAVVSHTLSDKSELRVPLAGGGVATRPVSRDRSGTGSVDAALARDLVALGLAVEEVVGGPADVEWALADGTLYVLQARPVTAVGEVRPTVWSNANVGEALPGVATPMTWSVIHRFARRGFEQAFGSLGLGVPPDYGLVGNVRGRVYLNLSEFMSIAGQIPFFRPETLLTLAGGTSPDELQGAYERHSMVGFVARLPLTLPRIGLSQALSPVVATRHARAFARRRDEVLARDLGRRSRAELDAELAEVTRLFDRTGEVMLACGANALSSYIAVRLLLRQGGEVAARQERSLFTGLDGLSSAEPGLALLGLSRLAHSYPDVRAVFSAHPQDSRALREALRAAPNGRRFLYRLDGFLAEHGLRAVREAELSTPRWREDPGFVLSVVAAHLREGRLAVPDEVLARRTQLRRRAERAARAALPRPLRPVLSTLLPLARHAARLREWLRACVTESLGLLRLYLCEAGRRMAGLGLLRDPDDVFFLTWDEVGAWLGGDGTDRRRGVVERRALHEVDRRLPEPPSTLITGRRRRPRRPPEVSDALQLQGLPASSGVYEGECHLARTPDEATDLPRGAVLVVPASDVGWTPLFLLAGAVVMDQGGVLSHAAVVAREYGIPTVVNVGHAMARLRTGQRVVVDGDRGTVQGVG